MSIRYELIPWDCEGITRRRFPTVDTLLEVAKSTTSPADSVMAWENGHQRPLTIGEDAEFRYHLDRCRRVGDGQ
jgi:hypothetical protein